MGIRFSKFSLEFELQEEGRSGGLLYNFANSSRPMYILFFNKCFV